MHVAHSNIREVKPKTKPVQKRSTWAQQVLYRGYKQVLADRAEDIKEIQKYFPGWLPPFEY